MTLHTYTFERFKPLYLIFFFSLYALCHFAVGAENDYEEYLEDVKMSRSDAYIIKAGMGLGTYYGGLAGIGMEGGFKYVTVLVGSGFLLDRFNALFGLRLYLADDDFTFRPNITLLTGNQFFYKTEIYSVYDGSREVVSEGALLGLSVMIGMEHDIGTYKGLTFSYGAGVTILEKMPEKDTRARLGDTPGQYLACFAIGANYSFTSLKNK